MVKFSRLVMTIRSLFSCFYEKLLPWNCKKQRTKLSLSNSFLLFLPHPLILHNCPLLPPPPFQTRESFQFLHLLPLCFLPFQTAPVSSPVSLLRIRKRPRAPRCFGSRRAKKGERRRPFSQIRKKEVWKKSAVLLLHFYQNIFAQAASEPDFNEQVAPPPDGMEGKEKKVPFLFLRRENGKLN